MIGPNAEPGRTRHGRCGTTYSGYRWKSCPQCECDDRGMYALACLNCDHKAFVAEREARCPTCNSGNTTILYSPDN